MSLENWLAHNRATTSAKVDPFKQGFTPYVKPHVPKADDTVAWDYDVQESELTDSQIRRMRRNLP